MKPLKNMDFRQKRLFKYPGFCYNLNMKTNRLSREQVNEMDHDELVEAYMASQKKVRAQEEEIDLLTEELNHVRAMMFGRKSEKHQDNTTEEQLRFEFNEAESLYVAEEPAEEVTVKEHTRKVKRAGKKEMDLSKLQREVVIHSLSEEQLREEFPNGWNRLADEVYTNVKYVPAKYVAVEHHIEVYCGKKEDRILRAEHPTELFRGSIATPSLLAGIMNGKYVNATPLYRMEQEFNRNDVPISRQNMAGWIIKAAERYLALLYDRLKKEMLSHSVVHADETPLLVTKDGREAGKKSYMWVYRSNVFEKEPVVIYEYQKTRKAQHPMEFLEDFRGTLVTDGYEVYHKLARARKDEIQIAGCWVHLKRKYTNAVKAIGKAGAYTTAGTLSSQAVKMIQKIFHEDNQLEGMGQEERLERRKEELEPLVDRFFAWVKEHRDEVTRKSVTGRAFTYTIEQEEYLRTFLKDGDVPMENNAAERAIRPFCIGKKNWVMCDTIYGAESSAIVYSLTETAKANNLKPYEYLEHLLSVIPDHMDDTDLTFLDDLLPWSDTLPDSCRS